MQVFVQRRSKVVARHFNILNRSEEDGLRT
jgi:hypothetical protein